MRLSMSKPPSSSVVARSGKTQSGAFAKETVVCVEPDGARKLVVIEIGCPYEISPHHARCSVAMRGLHDDLGTVSGGSTLQALSLALLLVGNLLTRFVQRGGRVLIYDLEPGDADHEQEFPFDAYFAPVDGALSDDGAARSLLAVHAALVGRITPEMRAVSFEVEDDAVVLWVYHDGAAPSEANAGLDLELIQQAFVGNPQVKVRLRRVDAPLAIRARGTLVFALRDEDIIQAVA